MWLFWMAVVFAIGYIIDRILKAIERRYDDRKKDGKNS